MIEKVIDMINIINMVYIQEIMKLTLFGISIGKFIIFFIIILSSFLIRSIFLHIADKIAGSWLAKSEVNNMIINAAKYLLGYLIIMQGIYLAVIPLEIPDKIGPFQIIPILHNIYILLISFVVLYFAFKIIDIVAVYINRRSKKTGGILDDQLVPMIIKSLRIVVVVIGILSILNNFGYNITSLIAGLGLGGLAFALAAQTTLSNIFGSVTIFSDKPFHTGDWVQVGDIEGVVEDVAFRTTRIRRFDQALVTVPNSMFVNKEVVNFSAMKKRKIEFYLGLMLDTPIWKIKLIVDGIHGIIEQNNDFDHTVYIVRFTDFGEYSLNIYVYCFSKIIDFVAFQKLKEDFNLNIMRLLENLNVKIAFPGILYRSNN